jgi:hypothetical protein
MAATTASADRPAKKPRAMIVFPSVYLRTIAQIKPHANFVSSSTPPFFKT